MLETESVPVDVGGSAPESTTAAPDTGSPAPVADAAAPPDTPSGPPRGPDGKFISAGHAGDSAATQPPAPPDAASVADPSAPAASDTTTTDPTAPNAPPAAAPVAQPFTFRASGTRVPIEGATYEPGKGLFIPDAVLPQVRRILAHGHEYATVHAPREREYQQQISALQQQIEAAKSGADAEVEVQKAWFRDLLSDTTGARLLQAVQNFEGEAALLNERAMRAKLEAQINAQKAAQPAQPALSPEQQEAAVFQAVVRVADDFVEDMKESGQFGALTDADWKYLTESVAETPESFLRTRGKEQVFDGALLLKWANKQQSDRAESVKRAQEVAKATKYNTQRQAAPPPQAPPKAPAPPQRPQMSEEESILARQAKKHEEGRRWEREVTGI